MRVEAPQGKAIFFEASNVLRQSPHQKLRTLEGAMKHGYLHLEGNVVIKMDCYLPTEAALPVCTVIRADSAQYNEVTGEIEATGRVHITLERTLPEAAR